MKESSIPAPTAIDSRPPPLPLALRVLLRRIYVAPLHWSGRNCHQAVQHVLRAMDQGHQWIIELDIHGFCDSIPHLPLREMIWCRWLNRRGCPRLLTLGRLNGIGLVPRVPTLRRRWF